MAVAVPYLRQDASLNSPPNRFLARSLLTNGITKCAVKRRSPPRGSASWRRSTLRGCSSREVGMTTGSWRQARNPGRLVSTVWRRAFLRTHLWPPSSDPAKAGPIQSRTAVGPRRPFRCRRRAPRGGVRPVQDRAAVDAVRGERGGTEVDSHSNARCSTRGAGTGGHVARPDPDAMLHESLKGAWHLAEFVWKKHADRLPKDAVRETRAADRGRPGTLRRVGWPRANAPVAPLLLSLSFLGLSTHPQDR